MFVNKLIIAVCTVFENNFLHHLIETICDAVIVVFSNLLWSEIGGDNGEKLVFVELCQQVNNWSVDVTVVHHLRWLCAKVINTKHIHADEFAVCIIVVLAQICNVLCIHNLDSVCAIVVWLRNAQIVQ